MRTSLRTKGQAYVGSEFEEIVLRTEADGTRQPFTALIADCEGFLGTFLDENPRLLDGLELVVYEEDAKDVCDYAGIRRMLRAHAFECVVAGEQNVWRRPLDGMA